VQIVDWLGKLGLEQYVQRFSENEIDVSVLPHLTDQDLNDIGIPLGHRRKILAAINQGAGSLQPIGEASKVVEAKIQDAPEPLHTSELTQLVGREEELESLLRPLVKRDERRRTGSVAIRRGGYWQVSTDRRAV
jgi:hypothetical protein